MFSVATCTLEVQLSISKASFRSQVSSAQKNSRSGPGGTALESKMSVQSLTGMAEDRLLHILRQSLSANARTATFACGGNVYFRGQRSVELSWIEAHANPRPRVSEDSTKCNEIEPIQVRFGESGKGVKVLFPLDGSGPDSELDQLISACQPATFGRGGENVMDEVRWDFNFHLCRRGLTTVCCKSYRKAGKLDESDFATSFCPYTAGIVDIISQLLLPQLNHDKSTRSIKAELYKLNVYGAPSGKFKAHVDTPRSERQIGSLVVALPVDHEGGQLAVRSAFKELLFDWSTSGNISEDGTEDRPCIKWAAFYSDCEHEVYEVTAGNRITLTYNLYITRGAGHLAGHTAALDPAQLPLYNVLDNALQAAAFLTQGTAPCCGDTRSELTNVIA